MRYQRQVQGQPQIQEGPQTPLLLANVGLYYGKRSAGSRNYVFGATPAEAVDGVSKEMPKYSDLLDATEVSSVTALIDGTLKKKVTEPGSGVSVYTRLNRIEVNFPFNNPGEYYVAAVSGVYEDAAFKNQINDADLILFYVNDNWVRRFLPQEAQNDPAAISALRSDNDWLSLTEFLQNAEVLQAFGTIVENLFQTLKDNVFNWSTLNVAETMNDFQAALGEIAQLPPPNEE